MAFKILRGSNQIGGSIVEISTAQTRIFVDFGAELPGTEACSTDAEMIEIINANPPDAIFFTHNHGDHIGLLYAVPDSVQIFMGKVAWKLICNIQNTLLNLADLSFEDRERLIKEQEILQSERVHFYDEGITKKYADIEFTPFRTDHSTCDSYMLRFKAEGQNILHTGDFRTHGRMGKDLLVDLQKRIVKEGIDILIVEGTNVGREQKTFSEKDLQERATELLRQHKYAFLICSSTNIESLASFYWAMIKTGRERWEVSNKLEEIKPPFMVNGYVKKQLEVFTKGVGKCENRKEFQFYRSYIVKDELEYKLSNGKTQKQHMLDTGFVMMVGSSTYYRNLMEQFREYNPVVIYSLWEGYLAKGKPYANEKLIALKEEWQDNFVKLHTSGHATVEELVKVIELVNPKEVIVPIHTEAAEKLREVLPEALKEKIMLTYSNENQQFQTGGIKMFEKYDYIFQGCRKNEVEQKLYEIIKLALNEKYGSALDEIIEQRVSEEWMAMQRCKAILDVSLLYEVSYWLKKNSVPYMMRLSAGASFILYLLGITKGNPLPPHTYCPNCKKVVWRTEYKDGFDVSQNMYCSKDGKLMRGDGHNIPWQSLFGMKGKDYVDLKMLLPKKIHIGLQCALQYHWMDNFIHNVPFTFSYDFTDMSLIFANVEFEFFKEKEEIFEKMPVSKKFADLFALSSLICSGNMYDDKTKFMLNELNYSPSEVITCREDVYFYLLAHGFSGEEAWEGMDAARRGRGLPMITEEMIKAPDKWVLALLDKSRKIYLCSKAQVVECFLYQKKVEV